MMMTQPAPKAMDGYVRVSRRLGREGPGYISPTVQREAIQRWADYRGVTIAAWHEDEDESGGTQNRPGLREAMRRVEARETDGIACWRLNRFARNVAGAIDDVKRVQAVGGQLAFVEEDIDPTGPFGEFLLTVLLAVATLERDNLVAGWKAAKTRAVDRGAHIGPCPFGYQRREDGTLAADPQHAPVVTEAFNVAARDGLAATVALLHARAPQRTWTSFTTRRFLACRTYLGRVDYGELVREGAHDALVTRPIFEAANHAVRDLGQRRAPRGDFPLSGIAACGTCGGRLVGARGGGDKRRMYRCADRATCDAPVALSAEPLEAHVVAALRDAFQHPGFQVGEKDPDVEAKVSAVEDAERELAAFASDLTARKLLGDRYHRHLQERVADVERAQAALQSALAQAQQARVVVPAELWDDLAPAELAMVLRAGLESVVVVRGRGPLAGRVRVVPKGLDAGAVAVAEDA